MLKLVIISLCVIFCYASNIWANPDTLKKVCEKGKEEGGFWVFLQKNKDFSICILETTILVLFKLFFVHYWPSRSYNG